MPLITGFSAIFLLSTISFIFTEKYFDKNMTKYSFDFEVKVMQLIQLIQRLSLAGLFIALIAKWV